MVRQRLRERQGRQNVREALKASDRAVVMKAGAIILGAAPDEIEDNARPMELN